MNANYERLPDEQFRLRRVCFKGMASKAILSPKGLVEISLVINHNLSYAFPEVVIALLLETAAP